MLFTIMIIYSFIMKVLIKSHLFLVKDILAANLDKIKLDNSNNVPEDDPDFIIHVKTVAWRSKLK